MTRIAFPAALIFMLAALPALAQEAPAADAEALVYPASFYATFSPRTALDMIDRTPGFTLAEPSERRGFSGAVGNVLIDGERPIAKSQALSDILQRIPAAQVLRIELRRGGAGDATGQGVVANVVRTPSAGGGVWSLGAEYAGRAPAPNGWAAWSGRVGRTDYGLGFNGYSLVRPISGERIVTDPSGQTLAIRSDESPRDFWEAAINGEVSRDTFGGRTRLTGQIYRSRYHEDTRIGTVSPVGDPIEAEFDPYTERKRTLEAGLSHDRRLAGWDLSLAALVTRTRFTSDVASIHSGADGAVDARFAQAIVRGNGETIVRATLVRDLSASHHVEAGVEGALNTLDQRLDLSLDLGGGSFPIALPNANLRVSERRGEAYLVDRWKPGVDWTVETRIAGEASRLSFSGDAEQSVQLAYFKPSLQVTWGIGARDQLQVRVYRDVGQLDFTDFVSAASLSDDVVEGGNPNLRPETSWRLEATADLRFGKEGAATLTLFRHWLSDAIDLVPVGQPGARVDAPGNIGSGSVRGAQLMLRAPLGAILPGASATLDATWQESRITDPLTGERRRASDFAATAIKAEFRQDLPARKLAWGLTYTGKPQRVRYRLAEIDRRRESPSLDLWAETTAIQGLKLRATIVSLLGTPERRKRTFFDGDRTGAADRIETSVRYPGRWLLVTVSGAF